MSSDKIIKSDLEEALYETLYEIDGFKPESELEIMTPDHFRWKEFIVRLNGPEGIDFDIFNCNGSLERPLAKAILERMGGIDIKATMQYFEEHGGYCDCEILFNVDHGDE